MEDLYIRIEECGGRLTTSIIEVHDLCYTYPNFAEPTLNDISLTIERGDLVLLTGPSGCGKTTLCRCLIGLIPHFYGGELTGDVFVSNLSVKDHAISELAQHVGFVFQNPENQLFALSVEKDVAFGLENLAKPREEMRKNVDWAMDLMGIGDLRESAPFELSGGQKQRVSVASVLAMKPEVMILDEPTSFLDPVTARKLFEIVKSLNEELGLTVVLVEHRLSLLSTYVNRIIVMDKGRVRLDGPPLDVLTSKEALSLGIGIPKIMQLYQNLVENNVILGKPAISVDEFAGAIRSLLKK
ncbi:MAG: energy-coupling factor ABC transporter ATP-binding protein [Candidatus Bathyarchaeota archaeon]|nr:energy-coupling factor ABC transporter ATP-binding protein [Candidatus Bathyarchaeota archaeon]